MSNTNLLKAILVLRKKKRFDLTKEKISSMNRANSIGEALEFFIKDAFCDTFYTDPQIRRDIYSKNFSYLGNQNNPPDVIIKNGDAIEVKKIDGIRAGEIQLNSSYPKSKLNSNSPMITSACRNCEEWIQKDIIYAVGHIANNCVKILTLVYGDCLAASESVYYAKAEMIKNKIRELDLELSETKEVGRVKRIDPLGITTFRIRGMWSIFNPLKVYKELFELTGDDFQLFALMRKSKYDTFPEEDRARIEAKQRISIDNVKIQDPDNPAKQLESILITVRK